MSQIKMYCGEPNAQGYYGYNAHPGEASYIKVVPFLEAIHQPPTCKLHGTPYLTEGGYAIDKIARRFRERGPTWECDVGYYSEGGGKHCFPHGYNGYDGDEKSCGYRSLVDWIKRKHEYYAAAEEA